MMTKPRNAYHFRKLSASLGLSLALAACSSAPPPPDWKMNSHAAMQAALAAELAGNTRVAEFEFKRAQEEIAKTGRLEMQARIFLARCAVRQATLEFQACAQFASLAQDAGASELAYARFLAGQNTAQDAALLPAQYRPLLDTTAKTANTATPTATIADTTPLLQAIKEPISRLIAASVLLQSQRLNPSGIAVAVETAANQGWSKALLAWLSLQARYAQEAGDTAGAARIHRRIEMVSGRSKVSP